MADVRTQLDPLADDVKGFSERYPKAKLRKFNPDSREITEADALIAYLYGECDPEQRRAVSAHVAVCQVCAEELMALDGTREHIAQWVPPDVPLGFQMVSQADVARPAKVLTPQRWWGQPLPAWALVHEREQSPTAAFERGRQLASVLRCAACHKDSTASLVAAPH
mgnify:CR=1 FL=1